MIKKFWKLLQPFHHTFATYLILIIIYEALQVAEGYVISATFQLFGQKTTKIITWIIFATMLFAYDELFTRLDNILDWRIITERAYPIFKFLKIKAVTKFLELDMAWHQENNSGTLAGKINSGVDKIQDILDQLTWEFVPTSIQVILSAIPLAIFSPYVLLIAGIALFLYMWLSFITFKKRRSLRKKRHDYYEQEWGLAIELVQAVETLKMFGQEKYILHEYRNLHDQIIKVGTKEADILVFTCFRWQRRVLSLARRGILILWIWQLYQGTLDIAGLIFVNVLTERLFHSFWRFARLFERTTEAGEGANRLLNLLEQKPAIVDNQSKHQINLPIGIKMENVSFSYDLKSDGANGAIHNLSFDIEPGQIVALVGPSGAGKTTIRKLITGLWRPQKGKIFVGEVEINDWSSTQLLSLFSYVPQGDDVFIFDTTIRENIIVSKPDASQAEIEDAAKLAEIHDFIIKLKHGYETLVGERGIKLSGGQKQRVALARAILADTPILILDEATNAVDAITEKKIQALMKTILQGKTAIIIAHNLSTIRDIADKIVVLDQGRKIEEGTHEELMRLNDLYAEMARLQG